jgi:transcriptional regulator with PAS, ATPase and Fis domain
MRADGSIEGRVKSVFEEVFEGQKTIGQAAQHVSSSSLKDNLHNTEVDLIARLHEQVGSNKSELAKALGIGRTTLWRRLKKLGLK